MSLQFLSTTALLLNQALSNQKWDYNEEGLNISHWIEHWPECGGNLQSPINIESPTENECNNEPLLLDFTTTDSDQQFAIRNNGHSLQAIPFDITHSGGSEIAGLEILHHTNDTQIRLKNNFFNTYESNINAEYCFDSLHFHWGETSEYGSEHSLNDKEYPLELHMVHYSCDYYKLTDATDAYSNGELNEINGISDDNILGVIGVLFEIGEPNVALDAILNDLIIEGVKTYNSEGYINLLSFYYTQFNLNDLLPKEREIIAYKGSLTTPPCFETVRWFIMQNTLTVSEEQMRKFRIIAESTDLNDKMEPNWRPLQNINERQIYKCKADLNEKYDKNPITDHIESLGGNGNGHGSDSEIHVEIDGEHEKWLWVAIGVLLLVTGYLCYLVQCSSKDEGHKHKKANTNDDGNDEESSTLFDESI